MALSTTPPISLSQIQSEVGLGAGSSLIDCLNASNLADKSLPVSMMRFLGYTHLVAPEAPVSVTIIEQGGPSVQVSWTPGGGGPAEHYRIERSVNFGAYEFMQNDAASPFVDAPVTVGANYRYRVRSENSAGNSGYTE